MADRPPRLRSPGRARCQLNFPRDEEVVQVRVLDKVKAARREVQEKYGADVMGVRGPQWTTSSHVPDSKYTKTASDTRLANQLLASSFRPSDLRHTQSPPRQRYDTQQYAAFTRGDATTGWNLSTELPSRWQQGKQLQQLDVKALEATARHRQHLERYQSPPQREEVFAASRRQQKQDAAAQSAALLKQYGPEGAAAMRQIMAMRKPNRQYIAIKASREDIQAVQALPVGMLAAGDE